MRLQTKEVKNKAILCKSILESLHMKGLQRNFMKMYFMGEKKVRILSMRTFHQGTESKCGTHVCDPDFQTLSASL